MSYFLWPSPEKLIIKDFFKKINAEDIESYLQELWPNVYPVLFSSARSGLAAILKLVKIQRPDLVWCPPYSSHCLFETIGRYGSPITINHSHIKLAVIYHQWGYQFSTNLSESINTIVVDDVADTLFMPGVDILSEHARFAIQSLPKVIGPIFGGVVFCKYESDAIELKKIRDLPNDCYIQSLLKLSGGRRAYLYWHGYESLQTKLPSFALAQIFRQLRLLPDLIEKRLSNLEIFSSEIYEKSLYNQRIVCNIPLLDVALAGQADQWNRLLSAGVRHFNVDLNYSTGKSVMTVPIPVHQDVDPRELSKQLPYLFRDGKMIDGSYFI